MFTLRAAVMWTVNDFPAYAIVSEWSTKGYMACPVCKEDVTSGLHAGKVCYLGHRRWLPWDHEWREKDKEFDGNTERRLIPREWSGDEIVEQLNRLDFAPFGKTVIRTRPSTHMNWTHKPMFFELPYWSKLKLRHNLDVMHVEKNVFDTLVGTILDIDGKTKDTIKARLDLERMGIRRGLWMNRDSDKARRDLAFFSLKPNDKKEFLKFVSSVMFPDGYASNIARCVNVDGGKFTGLKSHDCHVFMQRLLPVGIRHLLPEDVVKPIMLLSIFFSQLTAKALRKTDILQLRHDIVTGLLNCIISFYFDRLLGELKKRKPRDGLLLSQISEIFPAAVSLPAAAAASYLGGFGPRPPHCWYPGAPPPSPSSQPPRFLRFSPNRLRRDSPSSGNQFRHLRYGFCPIFHALADCWMSDLIRRRRAVTTTQSSEPPTQPTSAATAPASAATAPALMDHLAVGPAGSQAPASSASSVAQPVSARRRHRPASTTNTTSTDASGSQPGAVFIYPNCS
ncbi:hypothetical protein L3X38_024522 [Prunus dulcis]|uniref:Uncharacterized protein n=1 Tax=Prunus dulcis TaxID=3755 RepID=A0AAD4Z6K5_PRUDU|nr:hypothetical protein L3X38_024522 [Prunus dulcis]